MSNRTLGLPDPLYHYMLDCMLREPPLLRRLREETASDEMARMQIAPEQGQLISLLVRLFGVRRTLEIGVYTGYSSLCAAVALPPDGRMVACDISERWTAVARRYWQEAGVEHLIDLRLAPAAETLEDLVAEGGAGTFDFAFIDADKENYSRYYEQCLLLVRPGGLIALDNVFWGAAVVDPHTADPATDAIRTLNRELRDDARIDLSIVPIGDGLTLARKR